MSIRADFRSLLFTEESDESYNIFLVVLSMLSGVRYIERCWRAGL